MVLSHYRYNSFHGSLKTPSSVGVPVQPLAPFVQLVCFTNFVACNHYQEILACVLLVCVCETFLDSYPSRWWIHLKVGGRVHLVLEQCGLDHGFTLVFPSLLSQLNIGLKFSQRTTHRSRA